MDGTSSRQGTVDISFVLVGIRQDDLSAILRKSTRFLRSKAASLEYLNDKILNYETR